MPDQDDKCFACGRAFRGGRKREVETEDRAQRIFVGSDCYAKVKAGDLAGKGYLPPKGGPVLWLFPDDSDRVRKAR